MDESRVADIYRQLKRMAVSFELRPGDRINEASVARQLGASRTPLREALNRLAAENLVEFRPGAGFFCRELDAKSIFDLYEVRRILEVASVRLACERATDDQLSELKKEHYDVGRSGVVDTVGRATDRDEDFHIDIARLTGNAVLPGQLNAVNEQIRFIRWVDMVARVRTTKSEHRAIIDALMERNADTAAEIMSVHISRRMDQIVEAVKEGISNIYISSPDELYGRALAEA